MILNKQAEKSTARINVMSTHPWFDTFTEAKKLEEVLINSRIAILQDLTVLTLNLIKYGHTFLKYRFLDFFNM